MRTLFFLSFISFSTPGLAACFGAKGHLPGSELPHKVCFEEVLYSSAQGPTLEIRGGDLAGLYQVLEQRAGGDQVIQMEARKTFVDRSQASCGKAEKSALVIMAEFDSELPMEAQYIEIRGEYAVASNCQEKPAVFVVEYMPIQ